MARELLLFVGMMSKTWILAIGAALALSGCERKNSDEPVTAPLAQDQPLNLNRTERIRASVVADPSMSPAARNITIVLDADVVILRGPIASEAESASVERIAIGIAGEGNVRNELRVIDTSDAVLTTPNRVGDLQTAPVTPPTPVDPNAPASPAPTTTIVIVPGAPAPAAPATTVAPGTVADNTATAVAPGTGTGSAQTQPGLTAPGEAPQFTPGTIGITPGTTAPAPNGISPGTTTTTPSNPRAQPRPSTQPGTVTQPAPVPPGSTISPNNPGLNTPSTRNPPSMGPGTGNTPISPPPSPPPPSNNSPR